MKVEIMFVSMSQGTARITSNHKKLEGMAWSRFLPHAPAPAPPEGTNSANTLSSDSQPPEL